MMGLIEEWQALSGPARMVTTVASSWLFFFLSSLVVDKTSLVKCPAKGQEWVWKNRCISCWHAVIISSMTLYSFWSCFDEYWKEYMIMLVYHSFMMQLTLATSIGYFLHDLTDNLVYTFNGSLEGIAVLAHHIVAIVMFGVFTWMDYYCCFIMLSIATEINSVFLHMRKLLQLAGYKISDRVYIVNNVANVATFLVCRVGGQLYMKYLTVQIVAYSPANLWSVGLLAMIALQFVNVALANSLFASDVKQWRKLQNLQRSPSPDIHDQPADVQTVTNGHRRCADDRDTGETPGNASPHSSTKKVN